MSCLHPIRALEFDRRGWILNCFSRNDISPAFSEARMMMNWGEIYETAFRGINLEGRLLVYRSLISIISRREKERTLSEIQYYRLRYKYKKKQKQITRLSQILKRDPLTYQFFLIAKKTCFPLPERKVKMLLKIDWVLLELKKNCLRKSRLFFIILFNLTFYICCCEQIYE